ncbi:MAG TPA: hypothetical protein VNK92_03355 [Vicinamibacterales bacterium]|nr:hypothetical protein [Vicinamibacterales bacterium]
MPTISRRFLLLLVTALLLAAPRSDAQSPQALEALHQRLLPLFELAGVVFTDADETTGRLAVGVLDRDVEGLVRARLRLLGVRTETVEVLETEPIFFVATLRDRIRPVQAGVQIRFSQYLCSLGFVAWRAGVEGFVTASHCSDRQGVADGTLYYQPLEQTAENFIGTEVADPAFFRNANGCPRGRRCRYSDSNFSDGDDAVSFALGRIARTTGPNNGSLEIAGEFIVGGEGAAAVGDTGNKVGRTTGWTQGTVTRTCVNTAVSGTNIVLLCQDFVEHTVRIVDSGDSGSPVFRIEADGSVTLLGNLWGGSSSGTTFVYSPIANIERELGSLATF